MKNAHVKQKPEFPCKKESLHEEENSFQQQISITFKEYVNGRLYLEHGCVWCRKLDTSKIRSKIL
jgi:hypothetical protein